MQKFPLRNSRRSGGGSSSTAVGVGFGSRANGMTKECRGISAVTTRAAPATKPGSVRICNRVLARNEDPVTWDEVLIVGAKSKSWQSQASSSQVDSCGTAAAAVTTQGPMQQQQQRQHQQQEQTSARLLQVPCSATAATTSSSISNNNNTNKDDADDDNNRRNHGTMGAAPGPAPEPDEPRPGAEAEAEAEATATPAGAFTAREFMTFEQLRLGDQINFLLFDPYRTLKFLITELKSRLRVVAPDDINAHKMLVEIQQAVKRIRAANATKPTTTRTAGATGAAPMPVGCIPPLGWCHVIKEDPLINHARQVNSSCQTMESQLENVNACQMCERQAGPGCWCAPGCNQKRMNGNSNADDDEVRMCGAARRLATRPHQRSKDRREGGADVERFNYKSRQAVDSVLRSRSCSPVAEDALRIIAQLETELRHIQGGGVSRREGDFTALPSPPPGIRPTAEVHCKRRPNDDAGRKNDTPEQPEEEQDTAAGEQKGTFSNFNAALPPLPPASSKLDSGSEAATDTASKEAQTNAKKTPTQLLCHLEREKLLLLQQFRATELQHIQADLNELHVFIKDQLNGIYRSITRQDLQTKYPSGGKKTSQTTTMGAAGPPTASTPSLTAQTSSALSSSELPETTPESFAARGQCQPANGNANIPKSMMEQKHLPRQWDVAEQKLSTSSLSAPNAKDPRDISAVDEANKATGGKKSKDHHSRHLRQHHHFSHAKCCTDTPHWSGKRIHYSAVECGGCCCSRAPTAELARTSIHSAAKSTTKTSLAAMTRHQQCQHQPMTTATATATTTTTTTMSAAQEQTQLMAPPASRAQPAAVPPPRPQPWKRAELSRPDGMTNAPVRAISGGRSNRIWGHRHRPQHSPQSGHSWQCVNPKNPACCQLKKQICGKVHEPKINENNNHLTRGGARPENDSHSNCPQIHGCQKCRATVDWCCGLCPGPVHGVGMDSTAGAPSPRDGGAKGGVVVDDVRAGGDDGLNYGHTSGVRDLILHVGQRKPANLHSKRMTKAFQTDFGQFKEFLDEIIPSTPRMK